MIYTNIYIEILQTFTTNQHSGHERLPGRPAALLGTVAPGIPTILVGTAVSIALVNKDDIQNETFLFPFFFLAGSGILLLVTVLFYPFPD